jgi:hypothetical protein
MHASAHLQRGAAVFKLHPATCHRVRAVACKAEPDENEERLAQLEAAARKGKSGPAKPMAPSAASTDNETSTVKWKEGQLFPEGWDKMDPLEKAGQLYMGDRGLLFWLNKAAYASLFIMGGAWVLFRFVGPSLGLYELSNSLPGSP